jgi:N-terminal acetyltransferase B complex catalytic subunit
MLILFVHLTASSHLQVAPEYRRQGLAKKMMDLLEDVTARVHNAFFVDLFVRVSNELAITMYRKVCLFSALLSQLIATTPWL